MVTSRGTHSSSKVNSNSKLVVSEATGADGTVKAAAAVETTAVEPTAAAAGRPDGNRGDLHL